MKFRTRNECLNIFNALPEELILKSQLINKKRGEQLYEKDQTPSGVYFIKTGLIALTDIAPNGNESLLRIFSKDFFIGYRSFIAGEKYHANAIALSDISVLKIDFDSTQTVMLKYPNIFMHLAQMLARDLRISEERLNDFTGKKVASRIIETLVFLKQRQPLYTWTRREVGEFCGAKTETVTRAFSTLEKKGLIEKQGRDILIPDIEMLLNYKDQMDLDG